MAREDELAGLSARRISGAISDAKAALEDEARVSRSGSHAHTRLCSGNSSALIQARSLVDAELLTQMHAALERIQAQALRSFGAHAEDEEGHDESDAAGGGREESKEEGPPGSSAPPAPPPPPAAAGPGTTAPLARQPSSNAVVPQSAAPSTNRASAAK